MEEAIKRDLNIDKMCRSCLMESDEEMNEIFSQLESPETLSLQQILMQLTANIQIENDDGMPDKLCKECTEKAYLAYNFKVTVEQNDSTLRSVLFKDQIESMKRDAVFDENNTFLGLGIKTEIAFVDADPFIDDDGDFDYVNAATENSSTSNQHHQQQQQLDNNNSYEQCDEEEILQSDGNECEEEEEIEEIEEEHEDEIEEGLDENFEISEPRDKVVKKRAPAIENVDYVKDEDGKLVCQICNKKLADKKGLNLHLRLHTGKNLKRCHICNRGFIKSDHLKRHLLIHEKSINCDYCNESFVSRADYKMHVKEEHEDKIFDTQDSDKLPKIQKTRPNSLNATCKICDKRFQRISSLRTHLNQHLMSSSFDDVDIRNKIFLFNPLELDLEKASNEDLHLYVKNKLNENEYEKFYQIMARDGNELLLSDSESEEENEMCPDDRIELTYESERIAEKNYTCSRCTSNFKRSKDSVFHMLNDHIHELDEFIDKCMHCSKSFPNNYTLQKHLKAQCENKAKKLSCNTCSLKFMWLDSMAKHIEHEHPGTEKIKLYTCELCGKAFSRSEHLERHRKTHNPSEKKFECTVCQKKFNRKDNLRSHMKIHKDNRDDEDKHLCIYCGRAFSNSSNLIVHMRRHTGEKPYKCDLCEKGFPRSSDLQCHRRTHTGERPCLCTICGKGFSRSNKLVRHMRIHTGIRPYQCTYCDRAFTQSNDLTLHIRRHTGEKPYVCGVCGDRFIQGTALKQHQRMQGHFEGTQPSPYASISVNNPSRYTNSNLVNRRYMEQQALQQQQQQGQNTPMPIKPVIPRRRTANNNNSNNQINAQPQQQQIIQPTTSTIMNQISISQDPTQDILRSPSPSQLNSIPNNALTQDIKPNIQTLNIPQQYNGSALPLVTGNVEIATLFTFQNFPNHTNQ